MEYAGISRPHGKNEINTVKRRCRSHIQSHECSSKSSVAHTEECRGGKKEPEELGGKKTRQKFGNVSSGEPQEDSGQASQQVQREAERSTVDELIMVKRSTLR